MKNRLPATRKAVRRREKTDFQGAFRARKEILKRHAEHLRVVADTPGRYDLETRAASFRGQPACFGGVQVRKSDVSVYLMPVYVKPSLLRSISPQLKRRMQGRSCFNFSLPEPALFSELDRLAAAGRALFRTRKLL